MLCSKSELIEILNLTADISDCDADISDRDARITDLEEIRARLLEEKGEYIDNII